MIELQSIYDVPELLRWRREVIRNVFDLEPSLELMESNENFYRKHIADKSHLAFKALYEGEEAGCGAVCFTEELPSPDNPSGKCGYLMNIYVKDKFRQHGVAHAIVRRLVEEAESRECGKIYLETTEEGRPVYESIGFRDLPDMMKLSHRLSP